MARRKPTGLTDQQKEFIVQRLACYDGPKEVADAFKAEYGIEISPQRAEGYDPNKRAGQRLSKKWRAVFAATRKSFLKHVDTFVPEANKAVRIRQLSNAVHAFKERKNYVGMADMLERIAKEMGNVHTNRRELTGKDGKPVQFQQMTEEQVNHELAGALAEAGLSDEEIEHVVH